ncbi:MAG TPA: twin-arginine translocase subunit TatC [Verrucomicrobiae bacterium]|nr:twin-arginine translocase subunit TatC [Verrucomicrobiae bacterium]
MAQEPEESSFEEEEGGPVKPFLDHLEDLRWVLIKCLSALVLGMVICMVATPQIVAFLKRPLPLGMELVFLGPMDAFWISLKISLFGGIVLALPYILYVIGSFVLPALKKKEKKYFLRAISVGALLFLGGAALCYFVMLKISLKALVAYSAWMQVPSTVWRATDYFSFVCWFIIGMGLSFEMPVVILTLVKLGVIEHRTLVRSRKYVFVINLVLCAFITPDPVTTIFMVIPMTLLLEGSILISAYWERQKKAEEAALLASEEGQKVSD